MTAMMKVDFKDNILRLTPDASDQEKIQKLFPKNYLKGSKHLKARSVVNGYGEETNEIYLELKGFTPKLNVQKVAEAVAEPAIEPVVVAEQVVAQPQEAVAAQV